jgi:hypothetical protein
MKPVRAVGAGLCVTTFVVLGASALGCSHPATTPAASPKKSQAPTPPFESSMPEPAQAQVRAQHAWCAYLEALYHRAVMNGSAWDQLNKCNTEGSNASPEILERTAACSQKALDDFSGDPFTDAYAAEVKRCGTAALEATALEPDAVEPYITLACQRASACGKETLAECQTELTARLGHRLGLAIGALNGQSRIAVRRCLQTAACAGAEDQLSTCLDPLLDKLLWTPD